MKYLLAIASLMAVSMPVQAETVYLIYKSSIYHHNGNAVTLHTLPMLSMDNCEEAGAELISSERFEIAAGRDVFECVIGK